MLFIDKNNVENEASRTRASRQGAQRRKALSSLVQEFNSGFGLQQTDFSINAEFSAFRSPFARMLQPCYNTCMNGNNYLSDSLRWELAGLFEKYPDALKLYERFEAAVFACFPDVELRVQKTQAGFFSGCGFAWASPLTRWRRRYPGGSILITIGLPSRLDSPRVAEVTQPYPGRWTHHLVLTSADDLDDEFMRWLGAAYVFARQRKRLPLNSFRMKGET